MRCGRSNSKSFAGSDAKKLLGCRASMLLSRDNRRERKLLSVTGAWSPRAVAGDFAGIGAWRFNSERALGTLWACGPSMQPLSRWRWRGGRIGRHDAGAQRALFHQNKEQQAERH